MHWRRFPLVANLHVAEELLGTKCVELWHVTQTFKNPRLEITSGYATRGENAEADAT
jgi:hypothetical protein